MHRIDNAGAKPEPLLFRRKREAGGAVARSLPETFVNLFGPSQFKAHSGTQKGQFPPGGADQFPVRKERGKLLRSGGIARMDRNRNGPSLSRPEMHRMRFLPAGQNPVVRLRIMGGKRDLHAGNAVRTGSSFQIQFHRLRQLKRTGEGKAASLLKHGDGKMRPVHPRRNIQLE